MWIRNFRPKLSGPAAGKASSRAEQQRKEGEEARAEAGAEAVESAWSFQSFPRPSTRGEEELWQEKPREALKELTRHKRREQKRRRLVQVQGDGVRESSDSHTARTVRSR